VAGCGRRATCSRVPADPNVGEVEGGGLTDTRSGEKADANGVTMSGKVPRYQQSIKEIARYQRAMPLGTTSLPID